MIRQRLTLAVMSVAVALVILGISASSAHAACFSSSPAAASFADSPFDALLAPEILGVDASTNSSCGITINAPIDLAPTPGSLILGDAVFIWLNTDGNTATGDVVFGGADRAVGTLGAAGLDSGPLLGTWNGVDFDFTQPLSPVGAAGFVSTFDQLGVPAPTTLGLTAGSIYSDPINPAIVDTDFAPNPGNSPFAFPVAFSTSPPPPPPTPASAAPVTQKQSPTKKRCSVPKVRGLTVKKAINRLKKAGCRYRVRGKGRVRSTLPAAGTRTSGIVTVRAKRRKRSRKASVSTTGNILESAAGVLRAKARATGEK